MLISVTAFDLYVVSVLASHIFSAGLAKKSDVELALEPTIAYALTTVASEILAVFLIPAEPDSPIYVSCDSAQRTDFDAPAPFTYAELAILLALPLLAATRMQSLE